jgi:hypothetical protein
VYNTYRCLLSEGLYLQYIFFQNILYFAFSYFFLDNYQSISFFDNNIWYFTRCIAKHFDFDIFKLILSALRIRNCNQVLCIWFNFIIHKHFRLIPCYFLNFHFLFLHRKTIMMYIILLKVTISSKHIIYLNTQRIHCIL